MNTPDPECRLGIRFFAARSDGVRSRFGASRTRDRRTIRHPCDTDPASSIDFRTLLAVVLLGPLFLAASPAVAQFDFGFEANDDPAFNDSRDRVGTDMLLSRTAVAPGGDVVVAVILDMETGWHVWPGPGPVPEDLAQFDGAIRTELAMPATEAGPVHDPRRIRDLAGDPRRARGSRRRPDQVRGLRGSGRDPRARDRRRGRRHRAPTTSPSTWDSRPATTGTVWPPPTSRSLAARDLDVGRRHDQRG